MHISEDTPEEGDPTKSKVDASFIPEEDSSFVMPKVPNWAFQRYTVEFKRGGTKYDPFDDKNPLQPESEADDRRHVRGQLFSYADLIFKYQHRTAHFMLLVNGFMFRIMRWDRSGVIVSEATEYAATIEHTRGLLQLLYGLSRMDPVQAGLDPTATRLSPGSCGWLRMLSLSFNNVLDLKADKLVQDHTSKAAIETVLRTYRAATVPTSPLFASGELPTDPRQLFAHPSSSSNTAKNSSHSMRSPCPPTFTYIRELFKESLDSKVGYVLTVKKRDYLVGSAIYAAMGPIGRGTRGYVALEWDSQRFVFLKDTWRPHYVGVGIEGETLRILNDAHIPCVPTLVCHEDLEKQVTLTSQHSPKTNTKRPAALPTRSLPQRRGSRSTAARRSNASGSQAPASTTAPTLPASGTKRSHGETDADRKKQPGWGLRHLTHSRIVVAEVCLPLTQCPNSRTLVRVLGHAVHGAFADVLHLALRC